MAAATTQNLVSSDAIDNDMFDIGVDIFRKDVMWGERRGRTATERGGANPRGDVWAWSDRHQDTDKVRSVEERRGVKHGGRVDPMGDRGGEVCIQSDGRQGTGWDQF